MEVLYIILCLAALFIAYLLISAALFRPKKESLPPRDEIWVDKDEITSSLRELVRCKTVSYYDSSKEDEEQFRKLEELLPRLYPEVCALCERISVHKRAILFKWKGKSSCDSSVLMAHYDVVPVNEELWEKPPFEGVIEDGVLWGRGTLDTKVTFGGILYAANKLIKEGFVPENDIYLAFSGGEEINGPGAPAIVSWFKEHNISPALVVDEGGGVVEGVFPGVKEACGLIGIAEKGMMNVKLSCSSMGGHASAPAPHTPVGLLSKACCNIEDHPFPMHITAPARKMFDTLGRRSSFPFRLIFANLWIFKGVIDLICKKSGGELNALVRTTAAFTQAEGSSAPNVIPPAASMTVNLRLNPKDTLKSAEARLKKTVNNEKINFELFSSFDPSPISETDCKAWNKVALAVAHTWEGCIVSPYLMVQCSDSRHYGEISDHVYRFSAMDLSSDERKTIHGNNERIRLDAAARAAEFFIRLIKQC
ncbi:MAG: M20/M25/M40 family metallo-hydrolase [Ruminococcaceae bacterium]|nr:M20/M25/M40 family metallo-hydrolase [Oscillospiraceae bacterium]